MMRKSVRDRIARHILKRRLGELPFEIVARHTCDERLCINPIHIIAGSRAENMRDMIERGRARHLKGQDHPCSRFSDQVIEEIRQADGTMREIASRFNVSSGYVCRIRNGKRRPLLNTTYAADQVEKVATHGRGGRPGAPADEQLPALDL